MNIIFFLIFFLFIDQNNCIANTEVLLNKAVENYYRKTENKKRDIYRHPVQTLNFFGISREKKILEISPGRGWYTEIIGNFMNKTNNLFVTKYEKPPHPVEVITKMQKEFSDYFIKNNKYFGNIQFVSINKNYQILGKEETFDLVLTFRNTHNWLGSGNAENIYKSIFKIMKKGGVLGVVQHRANETSQFNHKNGYVKESFLIKFIEKQGFKFLEKSEINANSKDTKNYKKGVWTLPPRLIEGDLNKSRYLKIGESDRMTLKFIK